MTFGLPWVIHTDQGQAFQNALVARLIKFLKAQHSFSTAYYPEANGLVKRQNQTATRMLKKLCASSPKYWPRWLNTITLYCNTTQHSSTDQTSFLLVFGIEYTEDTVLQQLYNQLDMQEPTWEINEKRAAAQKVDQQ